MDEEIMVEVVVVGAVEYVDETVAEEEKEINNFKDLEKQ